MEDELDLLPLSKRLKLLVSMKPSSLLVVSSVPSPAVCSGGVSVDPVLNEVFEKWPGLPRGVKFDPSDEDLLWHLLAKTGKGKVMPHPFINMFVTSLDDNVAIGYTHPDLLPGIKQDGRPSYFFHRTLKTQCERQNICWNKIGKAKPVLVDGIYPGCKKIMVLYVNEKNCEKLEKTNWVMHQYQLGAEEVEDGALVVSKLFYQQRSNASTEGGQNMASDAIGAVLSEVQPLAGDELVGSESHNENQHSDINYMLKPSQMSTCYQSGSNNDYFDQQKIGYGNHPESFTSGEEKCVKSCEYGHTQISCCDLGQDVRRCQKDAPVSISTSTPNSSESMITQSPLVADQILSITNSGKNNFSVQTDYHTESKEIDQIFSCQASISDVNRDSQTCDTSKTNALVYLRTDTCAPEKNIGSSYMVSDARSHSESPSSVITLSLKSQDNNHRQSYETRTSDANLLSSQELKPENINGDNLLLDPVLLSFLVKVKRESSEGEAGSIHEVHNDVVTHYTSKENHSQDDNLSGGRNIQNCSSLGGLTLESPCIDTQCAIKAAKYPDNVLLGKDAESDSIGNGHSLHPEEQNLKAVNRLSNSASSNLIGEVKFEPLENCRPVPCQTALPGDKVEMELANDNSSDIDDIPLIDRMRMRVPLSVPEVERSGKKRCPEPTALPASSFDSFNSENPKRKRFSLRKKRKKTATNSVEKALEEDAPGLLEVLLDKGITAEEIKLYGDVDDDDDDDVFSNEDRFEDLESVIIKFFSERSSLFKFPSLRQVRGSKVDYCLPCLISLIEQTRYLRFRNNPVEWGWCRDLQSFIFVFEKHNRIVLERPEYGYATYFFELVDSLPIDWQIRRLVTVMKLTSCSRTTIIENKTILVKDLTEGEARVLEGYGWKPNSGLGSMLNYCDRVVHDKRNDSFISEWRARIAKLLIDGYSGGRAVLSDLPKKVVEYMSNQNPEIKIEPEHAGDCYPEIKLEGLN